MSLVVDNKNHGLYAISFTYPLEMRELSEINERAYEKVSIKLKDSFFCIVERF